MNYWSEFLAVALVDFLAIVSPGPAFALIVRNSFKYSRQTVVYTAIGLGLGIVVHIINSLIGVGLLISQSETLFNLMKFAGAMYLIYVGYKSLTDKLTHQQSGVKGKVKELTPMEAVKMGFITNATNPKALIFFMSIFTVLVSRSTPLGIKVLYGLEMSLAEFCWFAFLGTIITHSFVKEKISKFQLVAERLMGIILVALGIKIAFF